MTIGHSGHKDTCSTTLHRALTSQPENFSILVNLKKIKDCECTREDTPKYYQNTGKSPLAETNYILQKNLDEE